MKKIILTSALALLCSTGHTENWVKITQSPDGSVTQHLDMDSIENNAGLVDMHHVLEFKAAKLRRVNGKPYTSQKIHTEIDCSTRAMRKVSTTWTAGSLGKGEVLQEDKPQAVWLINQFDELTQPLWKIACAEWEKN